MQKRSSWTKFRISRSGNASVETRQRAVQVALELHSDNMEREVNGLTHAMDRFGLKESVLVTRNQADLIDKDGRLIRVLPAWQWLLE